MNKFITLLIILLFINNNIHSQDCRDINYPFKFIDIKCKNQNVGTYIINSSREFMSICKYVSPSEIDFNRKMLIGVIETVGGCGIPITSFEIFQNLNLKTINCFIYIESIGSCRRLFPVKEWILIDKPPDVFSFDIKVIKIRKK